MGGVFGSFCISNENSNKLSIFLAKSKRKVFVPSLLYISYNCTKPLVLSYSIIWLKLALDKVNYWWFCCLFVIFQVLLYDIRSDKPLLVKDHQFELPIKKIMFHDHQDLVLSMDSKILKLWDRNTVWKLGFVCMHFFSLCDWVMYIIMAML